MPREALAPRQQRQPALQLLELRVVFARPRCVCLRPASATRPWRRAWRRSGRPAPGCESRRRRTRLALEPGEQLSPHLQRAMFRVGSVHQVPGSRRLLRCREDVLEGALDRVIVARMLPVLLRDAPARGLVGQQFFQAFLLRIGRDMQVHLHQRDAVRHQHPLELPDAFRGPPEAVRQRALARSPLLGLLQQLLVPARMQDRNAALGRQDAPVTPQHGPLALDVVHAAKAVDRDELRVEPAEELVDHFAATGGRNAGHDHHDGTLLGLAQLELRVEQAVLQLRQFVLVFESRQPATAQDFVQAPSRHDRPLSGCGRAAAEPAA